MFSKRKIASILLSFALAFGTVVFAPIFQSPIAKLAELTSIPLSDNFTTSLAQELNSTDTTMFVNSTGTWTFPGSETTFAVIDPGKSRMEVVKLNAKDDGLGTFTIVGRAQDLGNGQSGTAFSHSPGAKVLISDSYEFWRAIQIAMDSKLNIDIDDTITADTTWAITTKVGAIMNNLTTSERDAVSSTPNGAVIYNTTTGQTQFREGGAWVANAAGGTVADASETIAGKVELATVAEQGTATSTGSTGARLVMANDNLVKTSSGAGDENKIAVLDANGKFDVGFLSSGLNFELFENLTALDLIKIINDGGTAKIAALETGQIGAVAEFESGAISDVAVCELDTDKFIVYYINAALDLRAIVGTVSDHAISYGSAQTVSSSNIDVPACATLGTDKVVVAYKDITATDGSVRVSTVSGTVITFGTETDFDTSTIANPSVAKLDTDKFMVTHLDASSVLEVIVATVSGTTPSFGSPLSISSSAATSTNGGVAQMGTDKALIVYNVSSNGVSSTVLTVVGTTVQSFIPTPISTTSTAQNARVDRLADDTAIISFTTGSTAASGEVLIVMDTSVKDLGGGAGDFLASVISTPIINNRTFGVLRALSKNKFILTNRGTYIVGKIVDGQIKLDPQVVIEPTDSIISLSLVSVDEDKFALAFSNTTTTNGESFAITPNDYEQTFGILQETGTAGQTKGVAVISNVSSGHSFSAADTGEKIYVQTDGTLATVFTNQEYGRIISTTEMIITN